MADAQVQFQRDTDANVASYTALFTLNGNAAGSVNVPRTTAGDTSGYTALYSQITPAPAALNNGDVVGAGVESTDTFGQSSPLISSTPATITIAITPAAPTGPANVTLVQV